MRTGTRKPGQFCRVNMLTPQPAQARDFFSSVLGWTYVETPGMGHRTRVGGCDIDGIFDLAGPSTPPGPPPHIGGLVKVENADAVVETVTSLGGKGQPAFDIADQGRPPSLNLSLHLAPRCADNTGTADSWW